MIRRLPLAASLVAPLAGLLVAAAAPAPVPPPATAPSDAATHAAKPYVSPYSVRFSHETEELIGDLLHGPRGEVAEQAAVPAREWYSDATRKRYGAWGPPARRWEPPAGIDARPAEWKRERVIAVAVRYEGLSYQHHHLPDWDPPAGWPWIEVGYGRNARGVDCSNFTGLVYNLALGVHLSTAVERQAEQAEYKLRGRSGDGGERNETRKLQRIEKPDSYAGCRELFRTGDLLFIRDKAGEVSHVVLWVGGVGRSPDGTPLVLDSTSTGHRDGNGQPIPDGVHLRPFRENSWYFQSLSHALRVVQD